MREGCGSTGSRLLRGERECFAAVERRFARFKGAERALYFSSGYLANIGVLTTLAEAGDVIFSDERNHASLIDGMRLSRARAAVFPHNDARQLERLLAGSSESGVRFVVVESLFSMDGDLAPLAEYAALCRSAGAVLVVDEAHAVGIYGGRGSGLIEAAGLDERSCDLDQHGWESARGRRRVRRGAVLGHRVSRPAGAAVRVFDGASSGPGRCAGREPRRSWPRNPNDGSGCWSARRISARVSRRLASIREPSRSQIVPIVVGENDRAVAVARAIQAEGSTCAPSGRPASRPARHACGCRSSGAVRSDDRSIRRRAGGRTAGGRTLLRGVFVTGTDTGVGKTVVCAALMHRYRSPRSGSDTSRFTTRYWKPIQTGIERDDDTGKSSVWAAAARARFCGAASGCRARCRRIWPPG